MFAFKKSCFGSSLCTMKTTLFAFFVLFWQAWFCIDYFNTCKILNWKKYNASVLDLKKYSASDFEINFFRLFGLWMKNLTTCQILNWIFFIFFNLKFSPSPTTCTIHIVFFHLTMYSHSLQNLRQLDNSTRHRSNNTSCTHFRKDLGFWFCYGVPLYSQYGLDMCRNLLLLVKLLISILQLFLSHTSLTSFWKRLW